MVKRALGVLLSLALLAQPLGALSPTAQAATLTAQTVPGTDLKVLPGRPAPIPKVPNNPIEDFFAVTLISLPFTALWSLLGALVVGSVSQHHFPPDFSTPMLAGAGAVAAGASVATGLVSVQWSSRPSTPTPTLTSTPAPLP